MTTRKVFTKCFLTVTLLAVSLCVATVVLAGIKERMAERLPQIIALKDKGVIGETRTGLLAYVGDAKEKEELVNAENADRKLVYDALAKKLKTTAEKVGIRRAKQLSENAKVGHWVQDKDGKWVKKQ